MSFLKNEKKKIKTKALTGRWNKKFSLSLIRFVFKTRERKVEGNF
jgi:hypothetical protein